MGLLSKGSKPVLGLNIGSKHIKAVEVKNNRGRLEVLGAGIRPTPEGAIANGIVVDPGLLGAEVRELLTEAGIRSKRVVSSVAGQQSLVVRIIEVPRMTKSELQETMKWEIERHIPFPAEDVVMDFQPLEKEESQGEEGAEGETMEVLLAVAQEELINSHVQALEAAGLLPNAIDIEPLAMARLLAVTAEDEDPNQTMAFINIGARVTDISIVKGNDLTFTRTVPLGGDSLTTAISEALGLQPQEAERAKVDLGSAILAAAAESGVDSMEPAPAAEGEDETPFSAFEFDGGAVTEEEPEEAASSTTPETESTGETPAFDLSLGSEEATDSGAAETESTGEVPAFDLSLDEVSETTTGGASDTGGELGGLDLSLDSDEVEFLGSEPAEAESESAAEPAAETGGLIDLDLDGLDAPAEESSDSETSEAALPSDGNVEPESAEPAPPPLELDLGSPAPEGGGAPESDEEQKEHPAEVEAASGAFELDFGDDREPAAAEPEDKDTSPGAFELDFGTDQSTAATDEEASPGEAFELDMGGPPADTEADAPGKSAAAFDLAPTVEPTEDDTSAFSFDLEEPSTGEDEAPASVAELIEEPEAAVSTEEDTAGGLMDLDEIAGLSELGTAGAEVTEESIHAAISPVINELLTETRRSLEYYTSRYQGAAIDKVLLLGGTARLRGLPEVLAAELGLKVEVVNPFKAVEVSAKSDLTREYLDELAPALSVGLGLALRDMVED